LPVGFLTPGTRSEALQERWAALLARFVRGSPTETAVAQLARRFINGMPPWHDGHCQRVDDLDRLDLDTIVAKRPGMLCWITRAGGAVSIQFPGNEVRGPASSEGARRFIVAAATFQVRALPDALTDQSKLVLVRRFVREGLLTVCPSAA
jgi:hypothetical protein